MADDKPTHLPAEGEGSSLMPGGSDLAPAPEQADEEEAPSMPDPQMGVAIDQG